MKTSNPLITLVEQKMAKNPAGIFSICSANPYVLKASLKFAKEKELPLLIESTCNQVNQFGGYMDMKPTDFVSYVYAFAAEIHFPLGNIYLGGDHLGPFVWKNEPAAIAMPKAEQLVHDYVAAGYQKIHLDASMPCKGDPQPLPKQMIAEREAQLANIAEETEAQMGRENSELLYVLGSEVPTPGGAIEENPSLEVTSSDDTIENIQIAKQAFHRENLEPAWQRTIAFVVQPGVEFSDTQIHLYDRKKARELSALIETYDNLVYEAHSTDYQPGSLLKQMVEDHFAILKVGPALTFAMRESVFALAMMEKELLQKENLVESHFIETLDRVMVANPTHWEKYYSGDAATIAFKRKFSFSDRCRYYWAYQTVSKALHKLIENTSTIPLPLSLISQYLPKQYEKIRSGKMDSNPVQMIYGKVIDVLEDYVFACNL